MNHNQKVILKQISGKITKIVIYVHQENSNDEKCWEKPI